MELIPKRTTENKILGRVNTVKGSSVGVEFESQYLPQRITVGTFVAISTGDSQIVAIVSEMTRENVIGKSVAITTAHLDLVGEIFEKSGCNSFRRGVRKHPTIGDSVSLISNSDLRVVFEADRSRITGIGVLDQDTSIPISLDAQALVSKHFAIVGTTGVGKSSGVAVIIDRIIAELPNLRVFILDSHNEYKLAFGHRSKLINSLNLRLPFWLFNFEEILDIFFGGRPPVPEEVEILSELIPVARSLYHQRKEPLARSTVRRSDPQNIGLTVDTPVPYLLQDLVDLVDERMGRLENRSLRMHFHRLLSRIQTIRNDHRYAFIFGNANVGGDMMCDLLIDLFRLDSAEQPIAVMQMAGLPDEVVDAVVSVLCRLAFDFGLWSQGEFPLLFICEEAHRYAASDRSVGFNPTRRAVARMAKEGRKYGVHLGLISQRPAELDPTILSQCGTFFAMRLASGDDQVLLRSASSESASNLMEFLPSLGEQEAIGFGQGLPLPVRFHFNSLPVEFVPRSAVSGAWRKSGGTSSTKDLVRAAIERWRQSNVPTAGVAREEACTATQNQNTHNSKSTPIPQHSDELPYFQSRHRRETFIDDGRPTPSQSASQVANASSGGLPR